MSQRSSFAKLLLAASISLGCVAASAQTADTSPIRLVIGFPPGATLDVVSRMIAEKLRPHLGGRMVVVENKTGAGGAIANQLVKESPADGGTLLIAPITTLTMYPHSHPGLKYDSFKDFTPIIHIGRFPYGFGVGKGVQARTLAEYAQLTKTDAKQGFFGSAGVGSATHYFGLIYGKEAGANISHIPYRGTSAVLQAVQSGELPAGFVPLADMAMLVRSGNASLLGIVSSERSKAFPDVPTFKEAGYNVTDEGQYVMYAPANLPEAMVKRIESAMRTVLADTEIRARFQASYLTPTGYDGKRVTEMMHGGYNTWGPVIRSSGFNLEK